MNETAYLRFNIDINSINIPNSLCNVGIRLDMKTKVKNIKKDIIHELFKCCGKTIYYHKDVYANLVIYENQIQGDNISVKAMLNHRNNDNYFNGRLERVMTIELKLDETTVFILFPMRNMMISEIKREISKHTKIVFGKKKYVCRIDGDKLIKCENTDVIFGDRYLMTIKDLSDITTPVIPTTSIARPHIIYLIRTREYIDKEEHVYKIGKTKQYFDKRMASYAKGSEQHLSISVFGDIDEIETKLINLFIEKFTQRQDIGREFFEGNPREMMKLIINTTL